MQGSHPEQVSFKELIEHLRNGDLTKEDLQRLLNWQPSAMANLNEFGKAMRLFHGHEF